MNLSPVIRHSFPYPQRGAASVAIAFLILLVIGAALATALSMSGSAVRDAAMSEEQIEALFLAESGLERAARNYTNSGACTSVGVGTGATAYSLGNGTFTLDSAGPSGIYCQVQVTGRVGTTMRRAVAEFSAGAGGAGIALDAVGSGATTLATISVALNVGTGNNRLLVAGITSDKASGIVSTITFRGTNLTLLGSAGSGGNPGVDIYYLVNPLSGAGTLDVTMSAAGPIIVGARVFTGIDQGAPIDASAFTGGTATSAAPTLAVNTTVANAWVMDVVAVDKDVTGRTPPLAPAVMQTQAWMLAAGVNKITGGASTRGPWVAPQSATMSWSFGTPNQKWNMGVVALRPASGNVSVMKWTETVN